MSDQLEDQLGTALRDLVAGPSVTPDLAAIERRARRATHRSVLLRGTAGVGVLAVGAVAVGLTVAGRPTGRPPVHLSAQAPVSATASSTTAPTGAAALQAAAVLAAEPDATQGDATELVRTTTNPGHGTFIGADLYADDGRYFYAADPGDLGAQVRAGAVQGDGLFANLRSAAAYAADGGALPAAVDRMAGADLPVGTPVQYLPEGSAADLTAAQREAQAAAEQQLGAPKTRNANALWENCLMALQITADQPQLAAGVLRILSAVPEVSVTRTTTDGRPTYTLSVTGGPQVSDDTVETLVITADHAVPVSLSDRVVGGSSAPTTTTFRASRVTLADLR